MPENLVSRHLLVRLLLLVLGAGVWGLAMYQVRTPQRLLLGAQDSFFLQGFQTGAQDALDGFRWTNGDGRITLRDLGIATPLELSARINGMRTQGALPVRFSVNGAQVTQVENRGWESYSFRVPADIPLAADRLRLRIQSDVFSPSDQDPNSKDARDLGVAVAWVEIEPLWDCSLSGCDWRSLVTIPPPAPLGLFMFLALSVFAIFSALGLSLERTQWVTVGVVFLLGLTLGFARILATQYLPALGAGAGALALTMLISRYAYAQRQRQGLPFGPVETVALVLFLLIVFAHLNRLVVAFGDPGEDGQVYFSGAKHLWSGESLYDVAAMRGNLFAPVYKIPAFYAMLQFPYRGFGVTLFIIGFRVVNEALYLITLFLLARTYRIAVISAAGFGLFAIGLLMDPAIDTLRQAQSGLLILFFITLSLAFMERGKQGWGGVFLALPFMIKLYPAFLLLPLVLLQKRRALVFFGMTVLVLFVAGVWMVGWEQNWVYLTQVLPLTQGSTAWPENASVFGFLARFFTDEWGTNDFSTPVLRLVYYIAAAGFTLTTVFVFVRYLARGEMDSVRRWREWLAPAKTSNTDALVSNVQWGYAVFALTLLIVSPLTWNHYLPTAMLAVPALLVYLSRGKPAFFALVLCALGFVLVVYGIYPIPLQELNFAGWKQIIVSYRLYGIVLLWIVVIYALWSEAKRDSSANSSLVELVKT